MPPKIGFIGFGEVASIFSQPLLESGLEVAAYDVLLDEEGGREILKQRVKAGGIQFLSLLEVAGGADYVLSTVTTQVAKKVAEKCLPHLRTGQVFLDLNSASPSVKIDIDKVIRPSGADFVEGAILGAVGATGVGTSVLVGGAKGLEIAENFKRWGLKFSFYSQEIGKASVFKMLRSIYSKGLEVLLLELLIAGKRAGIQDDLWQDILSLMNNPFECTAANWIQTHAVAFERRYHEMVQVVATMKEIGVEPIMTSATEAFFDRSFQLGLKEAFTSKPDTMTAVIDHMEAKLRT